MPRKPALIDAIDKALDAQAFEFRVLARLKYLAAVRGRKLDRSTLTRKPNITESTSPQPAMQPVSSPLTNNSEAPDPELEQAVLAIRRHCEPPGQISKD